MKKLSLLMLLVLLLTAVGTLAAAENLDYYFTATFSKSPKFYTGPGTNYLRVGKAQYGAGGQARVYGYEGRWLLLGYQTGKGAYRIGYFQDTNLSSMKAADGAKPRKLRFEYRQAWISRNCDITDDPVIKNTAFDSLKKGYDCVYLASYDDKWAYIELVAPKENKKARGFVPKNAVSFSYVAASSSQTVSFATAVPAQTVTSGDSGFYTDGVWATISNGNISTYSGPAEYYIETGAYFMQNQMMYCLAAHNTNGIWWILCRIPGSDAAQYVWTKAENFYNNDMLVNQLAKD